MTRNLLQLSTKSDESRLKMFSNIEIAIFLIITIRNANINC